MKIAFRKWEPRIYKAEVQAMIAGVVGVVGHFTNMSPEVVSAVVVVVGYLGGYLVVKE